MPTNPGDSELDAKEMRDALAGIGVEISSKETDTLVAAIDADGDSRISLDELKDALERAEEIDREKKWSVSEERTAYIVRSPNIRLVS